ncbi:YhgE/Pip domain-containing protein [Anaerocolumna xylanovorans]|uniref:Putative membrane protein n=1 Tax=Anaerocolumna xylanovorans DSM 12503 TaxID=1121345 RepID=A0A1M7YMV4_9FIRM|nr:YhgE/Pip domain-containing protein [Anaerocolumna xylanovorans]SHO53907.1 putative membrane protein [Anaerocolumna xylanovorans DSM 12503]
MEMIKTEWKKIRENKLLLVSFIVICCIPLLYASFFLKSMWDPYGKTENLPIAVVNEDKAVEFEGETLSVGNDIIDELKGDNSLDWNFVTSKKAEQGLKDRKYYMIVTFPENFSENASTVLSDNPTQMVIKYETNGGLNYLGEVFSEQAIKELQNKISEKVTKAYVSAIFDKVEDMGGSITEAADASAQIKDGVDKVKDGNDELYSNLDKLSKASLTFSDGTDSLSLGLSTYLNGVLSANNGAKKLKDGLATYQAGVKTYTDGVKQAAKGANTLNKNSQDLKNGAKLVSEGVSQLNTELGTTIGSLGSNAEGIKQLADGMTAVDSAISTLNTGAKTLAAGVPTKDQVNSVSKYLNTSAFSQLPKEQQAVVLQSAAKLLAGYDTIGTAVGQISGGLDTLSQKTPALAAGTNQVYNTISAVAKQAPALTEGLSKLDTGAKSLNTGVGAYTTGVLQLSKGLDQLNTKAGDLNSGISQIAGGSTDLAAGLNKLTQNNGKLSSGMDQIKKGAEDIHDGAAKLADGSKKLGDGLTDLSDGAGKLNDGLQEGADTIESFDASDATVDMIAEPSTLSETKYSEVPDYGHALAPYVLSLSLYVGCMLFNFIYPIRKVAVKGKPVIQWWFAKLSVGIAAATIMAVVEAGVMHLIGVDTVSAGSYFVTALFSAYAYMLLIMVLSVAFDNPGRFVAMVLLVLQLAGAGGTFPMQLTYKFYQVIHPFLPMTYSIYGFRQAISGGLGNHVLASSLLVLAMVALVSALLLLVSMTVLKKISKDGVSQLDDNQKLMDTDYSYANSSL